MNSYGAVFLCVVFLQGYLCIPTPDDGGYRKDVVESSRWDVSAGLSHRLDLTAGNKSLIAQKHGIIYEERGDRGSNKSEIVQRENMPQQNLNPYYSQPSPPLPYYPPPPNYPPPPYYPPPPPNSPMYGPNVPPCGSAPYYPCGPTPYNPAFTNPYINYYNVPNYYSPQGIPPQGIPPQGIPPQSIPPQSIPPQGAGGQGVSTQRQIIIVTTELPETTTNLPKYSSTPKDERKEPTT